MNRRFVKFTLLPLLALALTFTACSDDDTTVTPPEDPKTIAEIAAGDDQFSTLVSALERVDLVTTLSGSGPFTVFAPTNQAFIDLGIDLETLSDEALTEILLYHVIGLDIASTDLIEGQTYASTATATGPDDSALTLLVERAGSNVTVNGSANVTTADVDASNGVIHIINKVLLPLDIVGHAMANSQFSELVGALQAADGDLVNTLMQDGPFTVFAPLNSAFEGISGVVAGLSTSELQDVLLYHVVSPANARSSSLSNGDIITTLNGTFTVNIDGEDITLTDGAGQSINVELVDVQATNGVIHVLDKVLLK